MISLKFTGDRPIITPTGIFFLKGKDDKYIFIPSAYKLFMLISDNSHWQGSHLEYSFPEQMPNDTDMLNAATKNDAEKIKEIEQKIAEFTSHLDLQIDEVRKYTHLDSRSKDSFVANLNAIKPYRIQRETNKIIYHMMISRLVNQIHQNEINRIEVPPTKNFFRVLESIRGGLIGRKISSKVVIEASIRNSRPILRLLPFGHLE
jgi:hypothetical protein